MKTYSNQRQQLANGGKTRQVLAFTLPEMMVATAVFVMMVTGIIQIHFFGLRYDEVVESKLGSCDLARRSFNNLLTDIHAAKLMHIGNGSASGFTNIADGQPQQGNALQISLTTDTNSYIRYYFQPGVNELRRMVSGKSGYTPIAQNLTNNIIFVAEDFKGNLVTDGIHNYTIRTILQFYQYQYPLTKVGPGYYFDYYRLQFVATRRSHD